jgi:hypothetical protein
MQASGGSILGDHHNMALYVGSYDQHRDKDYTPIWNALRGWGAVRVLESLWLLESNAIPGALRDALQAITSQQDSLVVIQLQAGSEWSAYNAQIAGTNWLQLHLHRY